MRYLLKAFFARPDIPLLRLPWNALAVVGAGIAGMWDPMIWAVAGAGEAVYLFTIASNPGFQKWIDERQTADLRGDTEATRKALTAQLGGAARQRFRKLEQKRARLEALYREQRDDLFSESNIDALRHLSWLFLNLLVAQRNVILASTSDGKDLQKQLKAAERDLATAETETIRASKAATVRLLYERLANVDHRQVSLREINADLDRIEAQLDLAIEQATLRGAPVAISSHVELTSHLLNTDGSFDTTTTSAPAYRIEN